MLITIFLVVFLFTLQLAAAGCYCKNLAEGMNVTSSLWFLTFAGNFAIDNSDITFAALQSTSSPSWLAVDLAKRKLFADVFLFAKFMDKSSGVFEVEYHNQNNDLHTDRQGGYKRLWILKMVKLRVPETMENTRMACWRSESLRQNGGYIKENISCDNLMKILYRYVVVWAPAETRLIVFTFEVHDQRIGNMAKDLALNKQVLTVNNHQHFPGELAVDGLNLTCAYVHSNSKELTWLAVDFGKNIAIGKIDFLVKFRGLYDENFLAAKLMLEIHRPLKVLARGTDVCWISEAQRPGYRLMKVHTSCIKALVLRPCRFLVLYTEPKNHMYVFDINIYDADYEDLKEIGGFKLLVPTKMASMITFLIREFFL